MPDEPFTSRFGHARRQHDRLGARVVVVRDEVDGLAVEVGEHLGRDARETRFGVAHGRRRIAVDRAEVALPVDERVAEREGLREAHDRRVDRPLRRAGGSCPRRRRRSSRTSGRADRTSRFRSLNVTRMRRCDGLQAVAHVGQRAADDHRHRVVEERAAHLVLDRDGDRRIDRRQRGGLWRIRHGSPLRCRDSRRSSAFFSMKSLRGSTRSPMRMLNVWFASGPSSTRTCRSVRFVGIHRGLPELLGIHLAQALVALDVLALAGDAQQLGQQVARRSESRASRCPITSR